ncbi:MAG TPA: FtsQ-type POTRA domain-containing protein, partial [Candidatus Binatus sp.]|nr:FtsQ-type POTRA domain-containing protein [Candidatus Binatus sp.]
MQLKVYRKDNRKRDFGRWRRYLIRLSVLAGLVIGGVVLYRLSGPILIAAASLRDFIVENRYFSVREIQVRGGEKISGNEIVTIAGLRQGMNIWKIDPAEIETKIAKHPWVRRVLVHREFPRRITIDVEERAPRAIVAVRKLYY